MVAAGPSEAERRLTSWVAQLQSRLSRQRTLLKQIADELVTETDDEDEDEPMAPVQAEAKDKEDEEPSGGDNNGSRPNREAQTAADGDGDGDGATTCPPGLACSSGSGGPSPPPVYDLRECKKCGETAYCRKGVCVNTQCATWLQAVFTVLFVGFEI